MKVVCIVQARMGSERLPGKVIKPILGKPMILYTLDRLSKSKYIDKIILATSDLDGEAPLVDVCANSGYDIFTGDESNVLKRYRDAVNFYMGKDEDVAVVRVTGDCPLIDPVIVDSVISNFIMYSYDYARLDVPNTFVRGFDVEIFSRKTLEKTYQDVCISNEDDEKMDMYKEHVTFYMYKNPMLFSIGHIKGENPYNKSFRLCVDTNEDLNLIENIYHKFKNTFVSAKSVIEYLDKNPEIASINLSVEQKQV